MKHTLFVTEYFRAHILSAHTLIPSPPCLSGGVVKTMVMMIFDNDDDDDDDTCEYDGSSDAREDCQINYTDNGLSV